MFLPTLLWQLWGHYWIDLRPKFQNTVKSKGETEISNYSFVVKKRYECIDFVWLGSCHENSMVILVCELFFCFLMIKFY